MSSGSGWVVDEWSCCGGLWLCGYVSEVGPYSVGDAPFEYAHGVFFGFASGE